jgi:cytochrome c oxidase subunit IV
MTARREDMAEVDTTHGPGMKLYLAIWAALLCIAGAEVFFSYRGFSTAALLTVLLVLAILEAGVGLLYFMHLKYDRPILLWSFVLSVVFVLLMMNQLWPDAYRMVSIGHH